MPELHHRCKVIRNRILNAFKGIEEMDQVSQHRRKNITTDKISSFKRDINELKATYVTKSEHEQIQKLEDLLDRKVASLVVIDL